MTRASILAACLLLTACSPQMQDELTRDDARTAVQEHLVGDIE